VQSYVSLVVLWIDITEYYLVFGAIFFFGNMGANLSLTAHWKNNEAMYPFCTFVKDILAFSAF
jgi:hypothetical protein